MRKVFIIVVAVVLLSTSTVTAFAEEFTIPVTGTVAPIGTLDVTLPLNGITFVIDGNRDITFNDPYIVSNCIVPLTITLLEANPVTSGDLTGEEVTGGYIGAPLLVADATHTADGWNNLTSAQTLQQIALSINGKNISGTDVVLGTMQSALEAEQRLQLVGTALYGKAWGNTVDKMFKYVCVIEASVTS